MIGERIKKVRSALNLTQQEFSERIGVKRNTIAKYETNRGEPIDAVMSLICREFNVSEMWLRTGEGEMFAARSREDELTAAVNSLLAGENTEFRRRLILLLSRLNADQWEQLQRYATELVEGLPAAPPAPPPAPLEAKNPHEYTREEFLEAMGLEWDLMKGDTPPDTGFGNSGTASA